MGFSEDDRIRAKNRVHNEAYELWEGLKALGYSPDYIVRYADFAIQSASCSFRNEVYSRLISIAKGGSNESNSNNT